MAMLPPPAAPGMPLADVKRRIAGPVSVAA
jgi:hypothetical protein